MFDWDPARREFDAYREAGLTLEVWWRDDDAAADAPALRRLLDLSATHAAPVALAVIPDRADPRLAELVAAAPGATAHCHGWRHENHAPAHARMSEFGPYRPLPWRVDAALRGRARIEALFGAKARPMFTPPWHGVDAALVRRLAALGFKALSLFGPRPARFPTPGLEARNAHLDPIGWLGRPPELRNPAVAIAELARQLADRREGRADRDEPFGLLTHHAAHTPMIWAFVESFLALVRENADVASWRAS